MGFGVAGALGFGYVAFYCFGSAYIRPGMLKSTRPQFLRDYFTTGVLRDQYPRPLSMLMNYTFPELARNLIALIGVVGPVTWNAVLGNRIGMGLYIVGGSFGALSVMLQARHRPWHNMSRYDRATLASAAMGTLVTASLAFPNLRGYRGFPVLPVSLAWLPISGDRKSVV
eukprot:RCo039913